MLRSYKVGHAKSKKKNLKHGWLKINTKNHPIEISDHFCRIISMGCQEFKTKTKFTLLGTRCSQGTFYHFQLALGFETETQNKVN